MSKTTRELELEAECERIGRNRDMWRGQCDRQSLKISELRSASSQLANVAFNWSQNPGHIITEQECEMLNRLYKRWDSAAFESKEPK